MGREREAFGPLNFAAVVLTQNFFLPGRWSGCNSRQPHQFFTGCASARGRVSKTQLTPGSTEAACHFHFGVVADKQCTCFASRLMWERYPPAPPAFVRCAAAGEGCRAEVRRGRRRALSSEPA